MRSKSHQTVRRPVLTIAVATLALHFTAISGLNSTASAANFTWDITPGTVGTGNGTITDGSGNWDTTTGNFTADGGANNFAWSNTTNANDIAVFGTASNSTTANTYTVTLDAGGINAGGVTFAQTATSPNVLSSYTLTGGPLNLPTAGGTIAVNGTTGATDTIASAITGGPLTISSTKGNTLILTGTNTYSGGTTISSGTLAVGTNTSLGSGALTVNAGAAYGTGLSSGGAPFLRSTVSGLNITNNIALPSTAGYYAVQMGATYGGTLQLSGTISGGGTGVVLQIDTPNSGDATSQTILSGTNTLASGTNVRVNRGALQLNNAAALGNASLTLATNANTTTGNLVFGGSFSLPNAVSLTTSGDSIGTGAGLNASLAGGLTTAAWAKLGTGTLTLPTANTGITGTTTVSAGTIALGTNTSLGTSAVMANAAYSTSYVSGGAPFLSSTVTGLNVANNIALPSTAGYYAVQMGGTQGGTLQLSGTISGGGTGVVLQIDTPYGGDNSSGTTLSGSNTFAGVIRVNRGSLTLTNANAAGTASLFIQTPTNTTGNLSFSNSFTFANNIALGISTASSTSPTISTGTNNVVLSGVLSSVAGAQGTNAGFNKIGTGMLTLANVNTYTGPTIVSGGILAATSDGAFSTGNVTVTGGSLAVSGGTTNNYIGDGATLSLASGTTDALNYNGTDNINFLVLNGVIQNPGTYSALTNSSFFSGSGTLTVAVPEPATATATAAFLGLTGVAAFLRRRRAKA